MKQLQHDNKKSVFYDKRDIDYIKLKSTSYFYEMFIKKKIKSTIQLPQTIIFNQGMPKLWLFNKKDNQQVLKKNSDKLNLTEIARVLCGVRNTDEYRIDSLTTLQEVVRVQNSNNQIAFVRYQGEQRKPATKIELIKLFLESKDKMASIIQTYIPSQTTKGSEVYYVEYRSDDQNLPVGYKFFKKSTTIKQKELIKKTNRGYLEGDFSPNPFQDLIDPIKNNAQSPIAMVNNKQKIEVIEQQVVNMFKFVDQRINTLFQTQIKLLVEFLEKAYRVKIKKIVSKFMLGGQQNPYFMGLKEMYIEIPLSAPYYDIQNFRNELRQSNECSFNSFQQYCKKYLIKNHSKIEKMAFYQESSDMGQQQRNNRKTVYNDDKEISAQLFKNLILEKCQGDFCQFIMVEKNRGPLAIRKNVLDEQKKQDKKLEIENTNITFPYEISYQLILRTRECALEIIEILRKNKIFKKDSAHHFSNEEYSQDFNAKSEYPFGDLRKEVYNLGNLYKNVKICKNCFIVYQLTSKYFDNRLKGDLKQKQWRISTPQDIPKSSSQQNFRNQTDKLSATFVLPNVNQDQDKNKQQQQFQQQEASQQNIQSINYLQINNNQPLIKSASDNNRIKIMKKTDPKIYKLFMPKQEQKQQNDIKINNHSKTNTNAALIKTRRQMEVIRIAMGFLNYEDNINHNNNVNNNNNNNNNNNSMQPQQSGFSNPSRMQQLINQNSKASQIRKPIQLQENKILSDFHQEKIQMKKKCSNESDMRQRLRDYYQRKLQTDQLQYIGPASIYSYHSNFQHLRQLTSERISTPSQPIVDMRSINLQWLQELDLRNLCKVLQTPYPPMSIPDELLPEVQFYVFDQVTLVPYIVLKAYSMSENISQNNKGQYIQGYNQVIVFAGDMFDSAFEYLQIFLEILEEVTNTTIILINFPGQAYTIFDETRIYDNLMICELLDRLLYDLDERKIIQASSETFKFIGVGYAGFLFQTYLCFSMQNIPFIQSVLLVNSFSTIDQMFHDTLVKSSEVFSTCPSDMQELAFNYYSVISNSCQLSDSETRNKISFNPITLEGRQNIIQNILASHSTLQQFQSLQLQVSIVHSLKNCIVSLSQTDEIQKLQDDAYKDIREKLIVKRISRLSTERSLKLVDGGHSLIDENPQMLQTIFQEFIAQDQVQSSTPR